jgi:AraC-like DNA-binding protein
VRAPLLAEQRWPELIVCTTRIPRVIAPFTVPTTGAHHLVMLTAGSLRLRRGGLGPDLGSARMDAGEVHLTRARMPAYQLDWEQPRRELEAVHVLLDATLPARIRQEHDAGLAKSGPPVAVMRDPLIAELMRGLGRSLEAPHRTDALYADVVSELLALQLVRLEDARPGWAPRPDGRLAPGRLRRVRDYVHAHFQGEIRLADLAAAAGLSRYHFLRAFRAATGQTPHHYVRAWRVEEAKRLLRDTSQSIADIALLTGFSSQSHLTTRFRQSTGVTPSRFRRSR